MLRFARHVFATMVCGYLFCASLGCNCNPTRHPINVSLSSEFKDKPSITVVVTALNPNDANYLAEYPMSKFFASGDPERSGLEKVQLQFGANQPDSQSFNPASPDWEKHWKVWESRGATQLFVMAFLPHQEDKKGNLDPRRQIVPLGKCAWDKKDQPINFELTPARLVLLTPYKEHK